LNEGYLNIGRPNEKKLASNEGWNRAKSGETVSVLSAGGGGWGDPLERDPAAVLDDVKNEMLSVEKAREWYSVVINDDLIDMAATEKLRAERKTMNDEQIRN
jgi:N-methylhydantoinase B